MAIVCPTREPRTSEPRKIRGDPSNELDPVQFHLQAALQLMRDLPCASLEREQYYTWIYHLISAATNLIVGHAPDEGALATDLDLIKG